MDELLKDLTKVQRRAVTFGEGPLLVVAGAGSGKTRVVTRRIAHLIRRGVSPSNILAITFTNKAAGEMAARVKALGAAHGAWISTFHSFCAQMLRRFGKAVGVERDYTIFDQTDSLHCVKTALSELGLDAANWTPRTVRARISWLKNNLVKPTKLASTGGFREKTLARIMTGYDQVLRRNGALDFDDLLRFMVELLADEAARSELRKRFRYVLVDEYQDTNRAQYEIAKALVGEAGNICATGDPDQSIYSWRGATIRNILDFEKDFPGAVVIKLEENFRSTRRVLAAAGALISNNRSRIDRGLWTRLADVGRVTIVECGDEQDEADFVVSRVSALIGEGAAPGECAVLYRINALSRALEGAFRDAGVRYVIVNGIEFYQRKEVKDILAYLRVSLNPDDDVAFERIVNTPPRGIGAVTLKGLKAKSRELGISLCRTVLERRYRAALSGRTSKRVDAFAEILEELVKSAEGPAAGAARRAIELSAYQSYLSDEADSERIENINELVSAAKHFDSVDPTLGVAGFLENAALVSDIDGWEGASDAVVLMTVHAAKGLEFEHVFVIGLEEGIFPHERGESSDQMEEERRLCYVALTRAKKDATLTHTQTRMIRGELSSRLPSRFLHELPDTVVERVTNSNAAAPDRPRVQVSADKSAHLTLAPGDMVVHNTLGAGRVLAILGVGPAARATVRFFDSGTRSVVLQYGDLVRIGKDPP